jgi:hypothetical protein
VASQNKQVYILEIIFRENLEEVEFMLKEVKRDVGLE